MLTTPQMIDLYDQGYGTLELSEMTDVSSRTIQYRLKKLGLLRSRSDRTERQRQHMSEVKKGCEGLKGEANGMYGKRGPDAPRWEGGIAAENKSRWYDVKYREWRQCVFDRDKYTCQSCGQVGGTIHAHHIKEWAKYPDLRLDPSNGMTLCFACHRNLHFKCKEL